MPTSADVRIREGELQGLAAAIVKALLKQGFVQPKVETSLVQKRIVALIAKNLEEEAALEREAESLAEAHARQTTGMDQRRIIQGIMERLARERGFSL